MLRNNSILNWSIKLLYSPKSCALSLQSCDTLEQHPSINAVNLSFSSFNLCTETQSFLGKVYCSPCKKSSYLNVNFGNSSQTLVSAKSLRIEWIKMCSDYFYWTVLVRTLRTDASCRGKYRGEKRGSRTADKDDDDVRINNFSRVSN